MTADLLSKTVLILCDYDALYAAIELQLSRLSGTRLIRLEPDTANQLADNRSGAAFDLMIMATVSPVADHVAVLTQASQLNQMGQKPVLIISEQPSRPESDDKITYLNFPFDMDQLAYPVSAILDNHPATV